jgi:MFS transporter, DHA1 family, tetracycline resistance protein
MAFSLVVLAVFVVMMANTTILATLGIFGRAAGLGEVQVGVVISSSAVLFVLTSSYWGRVSDLRGRRPVILWGLGGVVLSLLLFAATFAIEPGVVAAPLLFAALLGARMLYGVLCAGVQPAGVAWMADIFVGADRTKGIAVTGLAVGLGGMAGPLLVAASVDCGIALPTLLAIAPAAVVGLAALALLRDPPRRAQATGPEQLKCGRLGPLFVTAFALHLAFAALQATNAFYVQDLLGLETVDALRSAGLLSAAFAAASLAAQLLVFRPPAARPASLLSAGLVLCLFGCVAGILANGFVVLLMAFTALGCGFAWTQTGLLTGVSLANGPDRQGQVAGQLHAAMAAAWIVGPIAGGALYEAWPAGPFVLATAAMAVGLILSAPRASSGSRPARCSTPGTRGPCAAWRDREHRRR